MSSEYGNFRFDSPGEADQDLLDKALTDWPTCHSVRQSTDEGGNRKCSLLPVTAQEDEEPTIVSGICCALKHKGEALRQEIEEMKQLEDKCIRTLEMLRKEQCMWHSKLATARSNMAAAEKHRDEAKLLLELHTTLQSSGVQEQNVKTMQKILLRQFPKDIQRMVGDCLNSKKGLEFSACFRCGIEFTDVSLWAPEASRNCRHTLFPCNHAIVCGGCARELWAKEEACPLCKTMMIKRPKIFKPGRDVVEK